MKILVQKAGYPTLIDELTILPAFLEKKGSDNPKSKNKEQPKFSPQTTAMIKEIEKCGHKTLSQRIKKSEYTPTKGKKLDLKLISNAAKEEITSLRLFGVSAEAFVSDDTYLDEWRQLGGYVFNSAKELKIKSVSVNLLGLDFKTKSKIVEAIAEGIWISSYEFSKYKSSKNSKPNPLNVRICLKAVPTNDERRALERAKIKSESQLSARALTDTPAGDCSPQDVLRAARKLVQERGSRLSLKAFNTAALKKMGANALLAVGKGSVNPPLMLHIVYKPKKPSKGQKVVALVGKGICFDSGGLSLKPPKSMEEMKRDMAGASSVLHAMSALSKLSIKHEVHAIIPLAENMPGGRAIKPGDVAKTVSGKTVEILNTDAEGRLILADALGYAEKLSADIVIDVATLTGPTALGTLYAGLFCNDTDVEARLLAASKKTGERLWPLPLPDEYKPFMNSPVADIKNIAEGWAGTIFGALFLQEFAPKKSKWAHVDMGGTAFNNSSQGEYLKKGSTGFGVRLFLDFLENLH